MITWEHGNRIKTTFFWVKAKLYHFPTTYPYVPPHPYLTVYAVRFPCYISSLDCYSTLAGWHPSSCLWFPWTFNYADLGRKAKTHHELSFHSWNLFSTAISKAKHFRERMSITQNQRVHHTGWTKLPFIFQYLQRKGNKSYPRIKKKKKKFC